MTLTKKLEHYILDHLREDHLNAEQIETDDFVADTVEGKFPVHNIIAKFPGKKDGIIAILGHYDTNYPLRNIGYVGANDGGSSTAILLEFANQFRGKVRDGYSVWLVWTDGEESRTPAHEPDVNHSCDHGSFLITTQANRSRKCAKDGRSWRSQCFAMNGRSASSACRDSVDA